MPPAAMMFHGSQGSVLSDISSHASDHSGNDERIDSVSAPDRDLTPEEVDELRGVVRDCLDLRNCSCAIQAGEDAADLTNFAVDLVTDGMVVSSVLEELEFMEMTEICPPESLDLMRHELADFLAMLHVKDGNPNPLRVRRTTVDSADSASGSYGRRTSLGSELRAGETYLGGMDLSAGAAANKKREELDAVARRGRSLKDRMAMFAEDGRIRDSYQNPDGTTDVADVADIDDLDLGACDPATLDARREAELEAILNNVALTEREQTDSMKGVQAKYGLAKMKMKIAKSYGAKSKSKSKGGGGGGPEEDGSTRAQKEMQNDSRRSSIDLSAGSAAQVRARELEGLKRQSGSLKERMSMYSRDGSIRASFSNPDDESDGETGRKMEYVEGMERVHLQQQRQQQGQRRPRGPRRASVERREDLMAVMKDKSLGREEKARMMDAVRARYPPSSGPAAATSSRQKGGGSSPAGSTASPVEVSADIYAEDNIDDVNNAGASSVPRTIDEIAMPDRGDEEGGLSPDESEALGSIIRSTLKLTNCSCVMQAEADAADLINFAIELVSDGTDVGGIMEEMECMELEICPPESAESMRVGIAEFLGGLHGKGEDPYARILREREDEASRASASSSGLSRRTSLGSELRQGETYLGGVDLSASAAATRKREELESVGKRTSSLKDRMRMYSEDGTIRSSYQNPDGTTDVADAADIDDVDLEACDPATLESRKQRELEDILNDVSLTEKEQTDSMKEVQAKYGLAKMKMKIAKSYRAKPKSKKAGDGNADAAMTRSERELGRSKGRRSSIDLSAGSAASLRKRELESLKGGGSLKDRMSMYNRDGSIRSSFTNAELGDDELKLEADDDGRPPAVRPRRASALRREDLIAVMKDRTLGKEEKTRRMDEIRLMYEGVVAADDDAAPAATIQPERRSEDDDAKKRTERMRRREIQAIMKDRSLDREERKERIAAVNRKYASP